jgi:hypothetical protein
MSVHERAIIRDAVIAVLVSADTDCLTRVSRFPIQPAELDDLPAMTVYTPHEVVDEDASDVASEPDNPGHLKRQLHLAVEIIAAGDDGEAQLDAIALQVEQAFDGDPTIGGLVEDSMLSETEIGFVSTAEKMLAVARLMYTITYYTPTRTAAPSAGVLPSAVYGSLVPKIGAAHVADYKDLTAGESLTGE